MVEYMLKFTLTFHYNSNNLRFGFFLIKTSNGLASPRVLESLGCLTHPTYHQFEDVEPVTASRARMGGLRVFVI